MPPYRSYRGLLVLTAHDVPPAPMKDMNILRPDAPSFLPASIHSAVPLVHQSTESVTPSDATAKVIQVSAFLALPLELRLKVYEHFIDVPVGDISGGCSVDSERGQMLVTRQSLLSLCQQVTSEWTPIFHRSTVIIVNGSRLIQVGDNLVQQRGLLNATKLEKCLLRSLMLKSVISNPLAPNQLGNIRRLTYDLGNLGYTDYNGWDSLLRVLRKHDSLKASLVEVSVYSTCFQGSEKLEFRDPFQNPTTEQVWSWVDPRGYWKEIITGFRAVFKRWNIAGSVSVVLHIYDLLLVIQWVRERVEITFTRPKHPREKGVKTFELQKTWIHNNKTTLHR